MPISLAPTSLAAARSARSCNPGTATLGVCAGALAFWAVVACAFAWPLTTAWVAASAGHVAMMAVAGRLLFRGLRMAEGRS